MKTQTKLKTILWIGGIITIVIMAITACPVAGQDGKDAIHGKSGVNGTDGKDGADGKAAPPSNITTLWLYKSGEKPFPILLEDQTGGKLTEADVKDIQTWLTNLQVTTWQTGHTVMDTLWTRANGNIRMIVEDVPIYSQDKWNAPAQNADFRSQGHFWAEDGRTLHIRYARIKDKDANKFSLIAEAMARTVQTPLPDLTKK